MDPDTPVEPWTPPIGEPEPDPSSASPAQSGDGSSYEGGGRSPDADLEPRGAGSLDDASVTPHAPPAATIRPGRHLSDRAVGKAILLVLLAIVVATVTFADPETEDPFWMILVASVIGLVMVFGLYELAGSGIGAIVARTPLAAARRAARGAERQRRIGPYGAREGLTLLAAFVAAQAIVWVPLGFLALGDDGEIDIDRFQQFLVPGLLLSFLFAAFISLLLFRAFSIRCRLAGLDLGSAVGLRATSISPVLRAAFTGVILAMGVIALSLYVPVSDDFSPGVLARAAEDPGLARYAWAFSALFLAPPVEEFVFRGAVFEGLRRSWGPYAAGVVVTVLFVMMHVPEAWQYWPALFGITLGGIAMLLARIRSGSLGPPIALHFGYNAVVALGVLAV